MYFKYSIKESKAFHVLNEGNLIKNENAILLENGASLEKSLKNTLLTLIRIFVDLKRQN